MAEATAREAQLTASCGPTLFVAAHAMTPADCRRVQAAMETGTEEPAEVLGDEIALARHARSATSIEVGAETLAMVESRLDSQRAAIDAFFGARTTSREGSSLLRYRAGGFYRRHVDRADVPSWPAASQRAFTLVLFLNSSREADAAGEFDGGVLRILPDHGEPVEIVAQQGMLVAFSADLPHEVTPVTEGCRDAVVDWLLA